MEVNRSELLLDPAFALLRSVRHVFAARVMKMTPSGRLQTAVLVLLPDQLCVCSNRGGLNTIVPLPSVVALTCFPRGKLAIHMQNRHDLVLSTTYVSRLATLIPQLVLGLTGRPIPVHQEERPAVVENLTLRPDSRFIGHVPKSLGDAVRNARQVHAVTVLNDAIRNLTTGTTTTIAATPLKEDSTSGGHVRRVQDAAVPPNEDSTAVPSQPTTTAAARGPPADSVAGSGSIIGGSSGPPLTMLLIQTKKGTITTPAPASIWHYFQQAALRLPILHSTMTAQPTSTTAMFDVRCVERPDHAAVRLPGAFVCETMLVLSAQCPHTATFQNAQSRDGHTFDSEVLWPLLRSSE